MIQFLLFFFCACFARSSFHSVERNEVLGPDVGHLDFGVIDPNALSVRIHFSKFNIPVDWTVSVFNVETNEQHRFEGWRKGSFLALSLFGNRATMRLDLGSESWKDTHAIEVDYIQIETVDDSRRNLQSGDCNPDADFNEGNVKNTECAHGLGSGADRNIKSVVKIRIGNSVATGFFFGAYNRILTNKHVLENPEEAKDAEIEIQYECVSCSAPSILLPNNYWDVNCNYKQVHKVAVRSLLWSDDLLDVALLNLDYDCPDDLPIEIIAPFDEITSSYFPAPTVGEAIYIVHHPDGQPKKITHDDNGVPCQIIDVTPGQIYSNCDTIGGSSGSPVFRQSDHKLIGLHRAGKQTGLTSLWASTVLEHNECAPVCSRMDKVWEKMMGTQFKCCATFSKSIIGFGDKWRICDDVPHVPNAFNDEFSSVKVTSGCKVITYEDEHFGGSLKSFSSTSWDNVGSSWNDKISSMRFRRTDSGRCRVKFYHDSGYGGSSVQFTGDQAVLYKWNDVWSSFKILNNPGCKLVLYRDDHFRDLIGTYSSHQSSMTASDQVSSFRIIPSSDQCEVELFKINGCTGTSLTRTSDESVFPTAWNDAVKSVRIKSGCGVILYQDSDFGGDFEHFEEETTNCNNLEYEDGDYTFHFVNKASSLKLYKVKRQINRRLLQVQQQNQPL